MVRGRKKRAQDSGAEGVLLVDKPEGPTSHDVIAQLRRALGTRTLGHAGTLDPMATGLLVVVAGRYTRLSQYLTGADKRYLAEICFGFRTTTDDRLGEPLEEGDPSSLDEGRVREALERFRGPQRQVPPAFSAIQVGGERLYDKARRGEVVDVPPREVTIHELELLSWEPWRARVSVHCSKGTYIRSLARDLGTALGVPAHLSSLRRTQSGAFTLEQARPLSTLLEESVALTSLMTGPSSLPGMAMVEVSLEDAGELLEGRAVRCSTAAAEAAIAHVEKRLVAIVRSNGRELRPARALLSKEELSAASHSE